MSKRKDMIQRRNLEAATITLPAAVAAAETPGPTKSKATDNIVLGELQKQEQVVIERPATVTPPISQVEQSIQQLPSRMPVVGATTPTSEISLPTSRSIYFSNGDLFNRLVAIVEKNPRSSVSAVMSQLLAIFLECHERQRLSGGDIVNIVINQGGSDSKPSKVYL